LGKPRSKVSQIGNFTAQNLGQTVNVGYHFGNDLDVGIFTTLSDNGASEGFCSPLPAFGASLDPLVLELGSFSISTFKAGA
jgi:hypothetical protein